MTNEATDVSTRASTYYSVEPRQYKVGGSGVAGRDFTTNTKKVWLLAAR